MLNVEKQIESRLLACPVTHQPLVAYNDYVETHDGTRRYPRVRGVPILFSDQEKQNRYLDECQESLCQEYLERSTLRRQLLSFRRRLTTLGGDYRTKQSRDAFRQAVSEQPEDALCLSIGGGPLRVHPNLVNLNIGLFSNVDVVADAYELPYMDASVDAIHCEAVLEHLECPDRAVAEMYRVLRRGGQVFAATPFVSLYHGYPSHFQNFTLTGHRRLFERAGFSVISSGPCVGPTFALSVLMIAYARLYAPTRVLKYFGAGLALAVALPLRPLDRWINRSSAAHELAATTYVHGVKDTT